MTKRRTQLDERRTPTLPPFPPLLSPSSLQLLGFVDAEGERAIPRHYYMTVRLETCFYFH